MFIKKYIVQAMALLVVGLPSLPFGLIGQEVDVLATETANTEKEPIQETKLTSKLDAIVEDARLDGASVGIHVQNAKTGEEVYSHQADMRLKPASNMKILTSVAALEVLGEDYQFTTEVVTDGKVKKDVLEGNLYIKGKGDPTILQEDLEQFARDIKEEGIKTINGDLIADDTWYDDVRLSRDLTWSDEASYYGSQVSALTMSPDDKYNTGTVTVDVLPNKEAGKKTEIKLLPETDYVRIVNKTETTEAGHKTDISIDRDHGTNTIHIEGTIPIDATERRALITVWEPTNYVLHQFHQALVDEGIEIKGKSKRDETPKDAIVLTKKKSMKLKDIIRPFMKYSNNGYGEMLTKEMGRVEVDEGSWEAGLNVIREVVGEYGVDRATIHLRDGSGMSDKTLIPARELTRLLHSIQKASWYPFFETSLPVAGELEEEIGGSLRYRMNTSPAKGKAMAKTGSLDGVSTLSGYVMSKDNEKLIFSILINNYIGYSVNDMEDEIVETLANYKINK